MSVDDLMVEMLSESKSIATVGFSTHWHKPSHYVPKYMLDNGYHVIPVHPRAEEIAGQPAYRNLTDVPESVDMVQIFRPSHKVMPHIQEAIDIGARFIWLQQGIANNEARALAEAAGVRIVMDKCMMVEHRRLQSELRSRAG